MAWQMIPYLGPPLLTVAVALAVGGYAWTNRDRPRATPLSVIFLGVAIWSAAYALQLGSTTVPAKTFWGNVMYVGIVLVPGSWLVFALEFSGYEEWVRPRTAAVLAIEPVVLLAFVWTNGGHELVTADAWLRTVRGYRVLRVTFGPAFWAHTAYSYAVILAGTVLALRTVVVSDDLYRDQAVALVVASLIPLVGNVASVVYHLFAIDVTAIAFLGTGVVTCWAVFRHRLLQVVPLTRAVARETLVQRMDDAVLVVDDGDRVADCNPAAAELVGIGRGNLLGRRLDDAVPELADALDLDADEPVTRAVELGTTGRIRTYDVRATPLYLSNEVHAGHLISLRDVTDRRQREQRLEVLNRLLRHNIRNDMTLIDGSAEIITDLAEGGPIAERAAAISTTATTLTERAEKLRRVTRELDREEELPVDLARSVTYQVEQVRRKYPDATIEVTTPETAPVAAGSAVDLVVEELLTNAVEHSDDGEPTVRMTIDRGDDAVSLRVVDDGPGIPRHERRVIEAGTESPLEHASGIGLWLANWVVESFGGTIAFSEADHGGSVVTVCLPRANAVTETRYGSPTYPGEETYSM